MIIYMFKIICVTNRSLCIDDLTERIGKLCEAGAYRIILREKDLSKTEYEKIAKKALDITKSYDTILTLHSFFDIACDLNTKSIHLPLNILKTIPDETKKHFDEIGCSVHSIEQAQEAVSLGANYLTAGHIFVTDCKKGIEPRGTGFLKTVYESVNVPVYAIGGIEANNIRKLKGICNGACVMSSAMKCEDAKEYMKGLKNGI